MNTTIPSNLGYQRLRTLPVKVGNLSIGAGAPIRVQTMTTTDTMNTEATVAQTIRCIEAGAELVRITAPSKKEAENLALIKKAVREAGYDTPLVADIHFTPNAAEIAARLIEKVRINPGNYVDKKKFDLIEYTDLEYANELSRIRDRFRPLVKICKEYGTAMRIGTNHGSLSDRIMSRYGDTPNGMVESALEFLRIARDENYHQIILSMKSSNPQVMVQAYRLLVERMQQEFESCYPLHLGVTEAGDGEDGRIKSAIGIGTLLEDGIGDTIRVSLTEDPELEIPVCQDIIRRYPQAGVSFSTYNPSAVSYSPFHYSRRKSLGLSRIGNGQVPIVVADLMHEKEITPDTFKAFGYTYDAHTDKWHLNDAAADFIYTGSLIPHFPLPGTLQIIVDAAAIPDHKNEKTIPLIQQQDIERFAHLQQDLHFLVVDAHTPLEELETIVAAKSIICLTVNSNTTLSTNKQFIDSLTTAGFFNPIVLCIESEATHVDHQLIEFATSAGALLLDGLGDGIWLMNDSDRTSNEPIKGRTYLPKSNSLQFLNDTAFSILQATRTRISKTEYISCPSCGRTLFDLQQTTAKIRAATHHLKGVKIAIMGCIVNGPGEMADADFGYVGSGPGKITLYKSKEVVKRNVPSEVAVDELIQLLKDNEVWVDL